MGQSHGQRQRRISVTSDASKDSSGSEAEEIDALADADHEIILEVIRSAPPVLVSQLAKEPVLKNHLAEDWEEDVKITARTVQLHVYDLEQFETANHALNLKVSIGGAFHAGVEVFGSEWSYGKRGVVCDAPRTAEGHNYRCSIPLGDTQKDVNEVAAILQDMCTKWRGADYDLLTHNCCSFATEFCDHLGYGEEWPSWIDRFARFLGGSRDVGYGALAVGRQVTEIMKDSVDAMVNHVFELVGGEDNEECSNTLIQVKGQEVVMLNQAHHRHAVQPPVFVSHLRLAPRPAPEFHPGQPVEYLSSQQGWIPTKVLRFLPHLNLYDLACHEQVPRAKIRPADGGMSCRSTHSVRSTNSVRSLSFRMPKFHEGDAVEYLSVSLGRWIPAKVIRFYEQTGLYDLNVKGGASEDKMRKPSVEVAQSLPSVRKQSEQSSVEVAPPNSSLPRRPRHTVTLNLPPPGWPGEACENAVSSAPPVQTMVLQQAQSALSTTRKASDTASRGEACDVSSVSVPPVRTMSQESAQTATWKASDIAASTGEACDAGSVSVPPVQTMSQESAQIATRKESDITAWTGEACDTGSSVFVPPVQTMVLHSGPIRKASDTASTGVGEACDSTGSSVSAASVPLRTMKLEPSHCAVRKVSDEASTASTPATPRQKFPVGAMVEFWSQTHRRWLPTRVEGFDPRTGLYKLDCRQDADPARMRWSVPPSPMVAAPQMAASQMAAPPIATSFQAVSSEPPNAVKRVTLWDRPEPEPDTCPRTPVQCAVRA
ncbi:unnamed protein product [Effrenium voratum]|uniref:PPPDE domain-containing protein n=1 Tax=Effrenium voratum TaxID=2562239 RepID=A0AA36N8P6_9DINO|nr:unnamed protein product [Effrenium voratum]